MICANANDIWAIMASDLLMLDAIGYLSKADYVNCVLELDSEIVGN